MSDEPVVRIRGLTHRFEHGDAGKPVLTDIDLEIGAGEIVVVTGPSGSGKTTLLTLIGSLRSVQEGSLEVLGRQYRGLSSRQRVTARRSIGFIFQAHNLFDALSAQQNVRMAVDLGAARGADARARAAEILTRVGLGHRLDYRPARLSGGQRQRVAIARALVNRPRLILADEPTAALDRESSREVVTLLQNLARDEGTTIVLVTHDSRILDVADRIVHLVDGRLVSDTRVDPVIQTGDFLPRCPAFEGLSPAVLKDIAGRMVRERFPAGSTIVRQGDAGDRFYVIRSGRAQVIRVAGDEQQRRAVLGEGEFFGEMALLSGEPRNASVVATEPVDVYTLTRDDFLAAVGSHETLRERVLQIVADRRTDRGSVEATEASTPDRPPRRRMRRVGVIAAAVGVLALAGTHVLTGMLWDSMQPRVTPTPVVPQGIASLSAEACGACHGEIYAEWRRSPLGDTMHSPTFLAGWKSTDQMSFCLNCHAPLQAQQPDVVRGIWWMAPMIFRASANPTFDARLQSEGVTCVVCHAAGSAVAGLHARGHPAPPHPVVVRRDLGTEGACRHCHQMTMSPLFSLTRPLIDTVGEWQAWRSATGRRDTCQDCHMTAVERPLVAGGPVRRSRRHDFVGARDPATLGRAVALGAVEKTPRGLSIVVTNQTGHRVPTGDASVAVEIRFVALDAAGDELGRASETLTRIVKGPPFEDVRDTTLREGESRRIDVELPRHVRLRMVSARVSAEYLYYANAPELVSVSRRPASATIATVDRRW